MKKVLLFAVLLSVASLGAQNKIAQRIGELQKLRADFKPVSILSTTQNAPDSEVNKVVDGATLATLDMARVNEIVANQYSTIELTIPYQGQNYALLLYKVNPLAEGFHVDTDKGKNYPYQAGVYYRGIINGDTNSVTSFNFFNGECNGIFSSSALGNIVVGKLDKSNNQTDYIVYSDAKMKVLNQFDCHTKEEGVEMPSSNPTQRSVNSDRCVQFYFEIDNDLYTSNSSSETATTNWMTSVFNNVQTLFENDGISTSLKSVFIWTEQDPYDGVGTSSSAYLNLFAQTRTVFDGDIGQLVGIDPGGLGGVAFLNTLCSTNNYSYSDVNLSFSTVPTYSWTVQVITHELGHSLGSPHTHRCFWNGDNTVIDGCGQQAGYTEGTCAQGPIPAAAEKGTIMSYCHLISGVGISFNNGFGPQPGELVLNNVNSKTCLSLDCTTSCTNTVTDIMVTNITENTAAISWTETGSTTSWQVSVAPYASTALTWVTVSEPNYIAAGLSANTYYRVRVRPLCENVDPLVRQTIFATPASNLCGFTFTDAAGPSANYSNNESWIRTLMPTGNGLKIRVTFTSFRLETDYDYLYIYNGPNEYFQDLTLGGLTGTALPSPFNSTHASGALTFKFYSDQGVVDQGWVANITCTGTLGTDENNYLDYSYYPNPTNGVVTISSKDMINEVTVYNVQGQLLFTKKMNELTTNVDISAFATGTYFFKLKINDSQANFKILKM
ncbi:M12 family metallo-peptidase [Flavobacterium sedimenticola]|uniref:M12 family metallo-peptidase n=1 Tax=Flavobacterium sedimenticola TaxID=3043286 RepID=A0ABT6XMB8_9FLAO|nr:M12 family metallo-peptidase [Flavobacterium sedimenticola]MDI9256221.1 M12 family metallo-peptidase [Flavobacterium sedimenticola]